VIYNNKRRWRVVTNNRLTSIVIICFIVIGGFIGFANFGSENAQGTNVSGTILPPGGTWDIAGSPYIVVGDVTVASGATLTIEAGVEVKFDGHFSIYVDGVLIAVGTETNRINITSNKTTSNPDDWNSIQINSIGRAEIKHCDISYGYIGIYLDSSSNEIMNNNVFSNKGHGIYLWSSSNNNITNNNVYSNIMVGIILFSSSYNTITYNNIIDNTHGISIKPSSNNNNITDNNISNKNIGIRIDSSSGNNIVKNNISSNVNYGLYIMSSSSNRIYHNIITSNQNQAYDDTNANFWNDTYPSGGNYWGDYVGIDEKAGPDQDVTGSDGIGDMPYINIDGGVGAKDNYPLMDDSYKPIENYLILRHGWNLISIPLIQNDQNLTKILETIDSYFGAVQWYDNTDLNDSWKHYKVGKAFGNDLSKINETVGFWLYITDSNGTLFQYNGTEPTENQSIPLYPGWNMVGYPSLTSYNRTDGLNNLTFGVHVDSIWTYNAAPHKWKEIGPSDYFEHGRGYWIHSLVEKTWEVPL
jgi:parallel beta-helix repeat protein